MKKYIAFIVADVVLFHIMCYITSSLTTQEKEVTPEQREYAVEIFDKSVVIANEFGPLIIDKSDGRAPLATTTAAILLSHFCIRANISMSAYKNILEESKDAS
jgi:hypothetical protein